MGLIEQFEQSLHVEDGHLRGVFVVIEVERRRVVLDGVAVESLEQRLHVEDVERLITVDVFVEAVAVEILRWTLLTGQRQRARVWDVWEAPGVPGTPGGRSRPATCS